MHVMLVLAQLDILIIKMIKQARMVRAKFIRKSYSFTAKDTSCTTTSAPNNSRRNLDWIKNGTGHSSRR